MIEEGAQILDIGAESTRPGAQLYLFMKKLIVLALYWKKYTKS